MPGEERTYLNDVRRAGQCVNLLLKTLGGRVISAEQGKAVLEMPASGDFCQGGGLIAGGVLATLADEAMAHAVLSVIGGGLSAVTLDLGVRYLRAAHADPARRLTATATVRKNGRTVCFSEADVCDADGRLLACAQATFLVTGAGVTVPPPVPPQRSA